MQPIQIQYVHIHVYILYLYGLHRSTNFAIHKMLLNTSKIHINTVAMEYIVQSRVERDTQHFRFSVRHWKRLSFSEDWVRAHSYTHLTEFNFSASLSHFLHLQYEMDLHFDDIFSDDPNCPLAIKFDINALQVVHEALFSHLSQDCCYVSMKWRNSSNLL